ncbi:hypothetical protein [Methylobacterium sp.]|jgi:hypothetical protein|uniref:hypothetical protein n=1 Tax=Methylobacterium sp. TaxID=409 RepID=UPI002626B0F4|nr:hypothetical protein [Methylobacterium sp.]MDB5647215.1 hypothetical protein [Methylobacterium sp.]
MSALNWVEQVNDGVAFCLVIAALVALAVACAPPLPDRRLPALAKRMRDTARY